MADKVVLNTFGEQIVARKRRFTPISQYQLNEYYILNAKKNQANVDLLTSSVGILTVSDISLQYSTALLTANNFLDITYGYSDESNNLYVGGVLQGTSLGSISIPNTTPFSSTTFLYVTDAIYELLYVLFFVPLTSGSSPPIIAGVRLLRDEVLGNRLVVVLNYQAGFAVRTSNSLLYTQPTSPAPTFVVYFFSPALGTLLNVITPNATVGTVQVGANRITATTSPTIVPLPVLHVSGSGTNTFAYSLDNGSTYTPIVGIFDTYANGTAWNTVRYVATGGLDNTLATSPDGLTWTGLGNSILTSGTGIYNLDTGFVAFGLGGANTIAFSADGLSWTGLGNSIFTTAGYTALHAPTVSFAGGEGGNVLAYSYNHGQTWYGTGNAYPLNQRIRSIAYNGNVYVALGAGNLASMMYSLNGFTWFSLGFDTFDEGYGVVYDQSGLFVAGGQGANTLAVSTNGTQWTGLGNLIFSNVATSIGFDGTRYIATGEGGNTLATSLDGSTWTGSATLFTTRGESTSTQNVLYPGGNTSSSLTPMKTFLALDYETNGVMLLVYVDVGASLTWYGNVYTNFTGDPQYLISSVRYNSAENRTSTLQSGTFYTLDTDSSLAVYVAACINSPTTLFGTLVTPTVSGVENLYLIKTNQFFQNEWERFAIAGVSDMGASIPVQVYSTSAGEVILFNVQNSSNVVIADTSTLNTQNPSVFTDFIALTRLDTSTGTLLRQDLFPWNARDEPHTASVRVDAFGNAIFTGITTDLSLPNPWGDLQSSTPFLFVASNTPTSNLAEINTSSMNQLLPFDFLSYYGVAMLGFDSTLYDIYTFTSSGDSPVLFNQPITGIVNDGVSRTYLAIAQYGITYIVTA